MQLINLIKNKLRAAGQRDPVVMAVDACEERTPAKGDDSFKEFRKGGSKFRGDKPSKPSEPSKPKEPDKPDMGSKPQKSPKPLKKKPPYNPYGTGTANPSNMSGSTGP